MEVSPTDLAGVLRFLPTPHRDERGFFSRTFDAAVARAHGIDPDALVQDSQSRSRQGVVRGLHGRSGAGEAKFMRCARGAAQLAVVDARPDSSTFGEHLTLVLDDETMMSVYLPRGVLVGFQALSDQVDICYRIDREHDASEDVAVRHDDPDLGVHWPLPVTAIRARDRDAMTWREFRERLENAAGTAASGTGP